MTTSGQKNGTPKNKQPQEAEAEDYSSLLSAPSNAAMAKLRALYEERQKVEAYLEKFRELVKRGEARLKALDEEEIPQVAEVECGLQMCVFPDGTKLEVKSSYFANIPAQGTIDKMKDREEAAAMQERRDKAMQWVEENHPHVVERKFDIKFSREDQKLADKFERDLAQRKRPVPVVRSCTVNHQTLNGLVRQLIDAKFQIPRDLLGVHEKKVAKFTAPRQSSKVD